MKLGQKIISIVASLALAGCMVAVAPAAEQAVTGGEGTSYTALAANVTKATLNIGEKVTAYITVNGKKIKGTKVKWTNSNKAVISVSKSGVVTGKKAGTATVTGTYSGKKLTWKFTVKDPVPSTMKTLKNRIMNYGNYEADGSYYYLGRTYTRTSNGAEEEFDVQVEYYPETDSFNFLYCNAQINLFIEFKFPSKRASSITATASEVVANGYVESSKASFAPKTYTINKNLSWDGTNYSDEFGTAMMLFGKMLSYYNIELKNLGYDAIGTFA